MHALCLNIVYLELGSDASTTLVLIQSLNMQECRPVFKRDLLISLLIVLWFVCWAFTVGLMLCFCDLIKITRIVFYPMFCCGSNSGKCHLNMDQ